MPRLPPRQELSPAFAAWDEAVAALPGLHSSLGVRRTLDAVPLLRADAAHLPDDELLRAAAVLAVLSHSYQYAEVRSPARQPPALAIPWETVRRRLGRGPAVLSYVDLIAYNWRLIDEGASARRRVENMRLLLPTMNNREENVFYLTQAEILARGQQALVAILDAYDAVMVGTEAELEQALLDLRSCLRAIVDRALPKIDPDPRAATHVDPVIWAKTVAPFAVPFQAGVQGPSGTASPLFNMLDIALGRKRYETFLGREIVQLRDTYPPRWREFLAALHEISLPDAVAAARGAQLRALFADVVAAYAGPDGFLRRHRMKVFGYLQVAFKVGRTVTIGGFRGMFRERTWQTVDHELESARRERGGDVEDERCEAATPPHSSNTLRSMAEPSAHAIIDLSDVATHNDPGGPIWIIVGDDVLDVTSFLRLHPGGNRILLIYAGLDVTADFHAVHANLRRVTPWAARYRIGRCRRLKLGDGGPFLSLLEDAYSCWTRALFTVVEMENALLADHHLQTVPLTPGDSPDHRSPYQLQHSVDAHERFLRGYLDLLTTETLPAVWEATVGAVRSGHPGDWLRQRLAAPPSASGACQDPPDASTCDARARANQRLLADLKATLLRGVRTFEQHERATATAGADQLLQAGQALAADVDRYPCSRGFVPRP